jgi:hypothetical protein
MLSAESCVLHNIALPSYISLESAEMVIYFAMTNNGKTPQALDKLCLALTSRMQLAGHAKPGLNAASQCCHARPGTTYADLLPTHTSRAAQNLISTPIYV